MTSSLSFRQFQKRSIIPCILIEKDVTVFEFIVVTVKSIIYSFELFKNRNLIIIEIFKGKYNLMDFFIVLISD